ncbi:hypothetical protein PGH12_03230 [Chryseobacterium wangxinyae]|uniref:hypothetical protein n=1 Tax=Chryseobacterium sp. CY350 TaxID=2997336 RepID=UPI00226D71EF|nr:hypothetical protein [Chryseobacterium sp. CY350]MCY0978391.1 hypothetical protein [Chryseobacterium sp. CY350]WBZ96167.1 hypothetical protein PGH12_03230 [Chryseobacterium sp. CY350]
MATYESLIKLKGSLGDLVFYNLNGKNVVRKKSGFNKNSFKKSASYEKVRQNSSEFGHCSKIGKTIRQCLDFYIKKSEDPLLYQKFAKVMTEIKDLDIVSEKGKRSVKKGLETELGYQLLKKFQFGIIENLENIAPVSIGLWDKSLVLDKNTACDEMVVETLSVDFESYTSKNFQQIINIHNQSNEYLFEKHFSDEELLLHFVVLKNEGKIVKMGFV